MAFRKLAKALHPDCSAGDKIAESRFAAVREAYAILGNTEWRAVYDQELERIRLGTQAQLTDQNGSHIESRERRIWREVAMTAAATVVLTACFVTGISIWQQNSSGLPVNPLARSDAGPTVTYVPPTISKEELAEALFGSQASQYANETTAPSKETTATNDVIAAISEPSPPSLVVIATNGEPLRPSNEAPASSAVSSAAIEPPPTPLMASAELASVGGPNPPADGPAVLPSKTLDTATRAQAERLIGLGDRHLADGNVAIARLFFTRAVDLGFAPAAIRLADTFEAQVLARHGVLGVRPDSAEAQRWRKRASELGK